MSYPSNVYSHCPRPPNPPFAFQPGLMPGLVPGPSPQAAMLHPWTPLLQAVRHVVNEAIEQNAFTHKSSLQSLKRGPGTETGHTSNATSGISWEEAKNLFSSFASDVKDSMEKQSSGFLEALNTNKVSSDSSATNSDDEAQKLQQVLLSTETLRAEVESLSALLYSKINLQVRDEPATSCTALAECQKATDEMMRRWSAMAARFEQILQSAESCTQNMRSPVTQNETSNSVKPSKTKRIKDSHELLGGPRVTRATTARQKRRGRGGKRN